MYSGFGSGRALAGAVRAPSLSAGFRVRLRECMQIKLVLVDFDDTLVITEPRFQNARRVLFERLAAAGFEEELCRTVHEQEVDPEMLQRYGLGPGRLEHSFRETYTRLCDRLGHALEEALAEEFAVIGRGVAGPSEPIEGALEALRT